MSSNVYLRESQVSKKIPPSGNIIDVNKKPIIIKRDIKHQAQWKKYLPNLAFINIETIVPSNTKTNTTIFAQKYPKILKEMTSKISVILTVELYKSTINKSKVSYNASTAV